MKRQSTRRLALAGMMGAVAFVLMFLSFPTPLNPFAELDFSALPELIGGFILGPIGALEIITIKILLKLVFQGTSTAFTGELCAFILSVCYVLPAVLYYRKHRTKKGAIVGIALGAVIAVIASVITNIYLIYPFYMTAYGMPMESIVAMAQSAMPFVDTEWELLLYVTAPFNLLKGVVLSALTFLLYKRLSPLLHVKK